jgi:hypothetical protein
MCIGRDPSAKSFGDYLYVIYRDEKSWIELNVLEAVLHESGYVYTTPGEVSALTVHGALARRRVADLLH